MFIQRAKYLVRIIIFPSTGWNPCEICTGNFSCCCFLGGCWNSCSKRQNKDLSPCGPSATHYDLSFLSLWFSSGSVKVVECKISHDGPMTIGPVLARRESHCLAPCLFLYSGSNFALCLGITLCPCLSHSFLFRGPTICSDCVSKLTEASMVGQCREKASTAKCNLCVRHPPLSVNPDLR